MAIIESLVEYIRGDFSKPKSSSRGNHAKSGGNKGLKSYIAAKEGSSKTSSGKEGKGKDNWKKFMPKTK